MKYKPYDGYKDSGIEWIGDIPVGWEVKKLKYLTNTPLMYGANESPDSTDEEQPRYIRITDIDDNGSLRDDTFASLNIGKATPYLLKKLDILFARSGATVGKSYIYYGENEQACFAGYLIKLSLNVNKANAKFIYYNTLSTGYKSWIESNTIQATIQNVSAEKYNNFVVGLPPLSEQTTIANYLDAETAKIANIISAKHRLIEKLQEKRSAVISHAVTKGLDPNAKMKPSGIAWIGDIPEGWAVVPLTKYLSSLVDYRGKTPVKVDDGIFLVTARNIKNGIIDYSLSQEFVSEEDYDEIMRRGKPKIGDVLFTTEAPLGEVANVDNEGIALAQRIIKICGQKSKVDNYFMKYWLLSAVFQGNLQSLATGSTALGIKASKLHLLRLMLPPLREQTAIVTYLDSETAKIDEIIAKTKASIEKLNEYKTALISACVTGKIDVRGVIK